METKDKQCAHHGSVASCGTIPPLERVCYFFGQLLEPADFRAEQSYFATLLALLGRHTAGWGVVCGLDVEISPAPPERCDDQPEHERLVLTVTPGIAIDCCGRFIIQRESSHCQLWPLLGSAERTELLAGQELYVSIERIERPVHPSRVVDSGCDPLSAVQYGRIRDESRVVVTLTPPEHLTCEACLEPCPDPRVLLASIQLSDPDHSAAVSVHPELRRLLARHELATISDVGWVHRGTYRRRDAEVLLSTGVGIRFSRPVRMATLQPGVIDLVVYEGGGGRRDAWYFKEVALETAPGDELVTEVLVRVSQPEGFQDRDRILLRVRCDFILDECCRAVSGAHLGGGVPFDLALSPGKVTHPQPHPMPCAHPPDRSGPWRSGNGVEGGVWESWIHVVRDDDYGGHATTAEETVR